ncbi:glucosamine-6-phosphate deaminase [Janibacter cremeus]|uniref:Glucosamine-6-phosphate deaminase n=1 Tax=Janibacter cremeus TaxID=1285192 RepID=A0A852VRH7_9MICO|nr:glucosamine-6-phosphate deaminase [Janibacter cremeus]NYF98040.1 glucosamine-6-phosphate deaminase [Janibacter cremeus]
MEIIISSDLERIAMLGADAVAEHVLADPTAVLGLATGSSPLRVYRELGRRVAAGELSLRRCRAFLLDEYLGLPADHPESYRAVIERDFVRLVDIDSAHVGGLDCSAADARSSCAAYEERIAAAGGIDVQILGVGGNGHIAFNEPGSPAASRTREAALTEQTRRDNARFFGGDVDAVPQHCLTQGIGTILEAKHLVLIATGEHKAQAVRELVEGRVNAECPVTALQQHPHVTVLLDGAAASLLRSQDHDLAAQPSQR